MTEYPHTDIRHHFEKLASGEKPFKKNGLIYINPQSGSGAKDLKIVSPSQDAIDQAKSDLKRGLDDTDIYEDAIYSDAKRKKFSNNPVKKRRKKTSTKSTRTKKKKKTKTKKRKPIKKGKKKKAKKAKKNRKK